MLGLCLAVPLWCSQRAAIGQTPQDQDSPDRSAYVRRAVREFDKAVFYKPRVEGVEAEVGALAPLIVREVSGEAAEPAAPQWLKAVAFENWFRPNQEAHKPTVYYETGTLTIAGIEYDVITYTWFDVATSPPVTEPKPRKLTTVIGHDDFPILWEFEHMLGPPRPRLLFVSASLERQAADEFRRGRRHDVEWTFDVAPGAIIVRVIEDGPIPMGPYVYLDAVSGDVTTLLCRCSPSQVREFVEEGFYDLRPMEQLNAHLAQHRWKTCGALSLIQDQNRRPYDFLLRWPVGPPKRQLMGPPSLYAP